MCLRVDAVIIILNNLEMYTSVEVFYKYSFVSIATVL